MIPLVSNLIGSSKIIDNQTVRARTTAAVRQTAAEKGGAEGAAGRLASAALQNPESAVASFLVRIATNPAIAAAACVDCGYPDVQDTDILFVVAGSWDEIAAAEFPDPDAA